MANLDIYNAVRDVPQEAKKSIGAGRLKGFTDINPMWRIKALTEQFGPCGIGWKYVITDKRLEHGANDEIAAFLDVDLFYKQNGEWSEAVPGTGGSSFVAKERNGLYVSDECFKMALTDALSVACKALGFGADVYWDKDKTKYDKDDQPEQPKIFCKYCNAEIKAAKKGDKIITPEEIATTSKEKYGMVMCVKCMREVSAKAEAPQGEPSETGF